MDTLLFAKVLSGLCSVLCPTSMVYALIEDTPEPDFSWVFVGAPILAAVASFFLTVCIAGLMFAFS